MQPRDDLEELVALPDLHKHQLARDLLTELGAGNIRVQGDELVHGCLISAYHRDQDKNPTASLNASKWLYNCLGCGAGGSVLWLIATVRDCTIEQARAWLRGEAGLDRAMELPQLLALFDSLYADQAKPEPLPVYSERMLDQWLENGIPSYAIRERGIPLDTAVRTGICLDADGLIGNPPASYGPRMVIPHWWEGKLVGWQSRRLPGSEGPKYKSTPGFPKDRTLYNYDPQAGCRVVVESPMSVLRHMHHQPMTGTFGSEVTEAQLRLLTQRIRVRTNLPAWEQHRVVVESPTLIWWPDPDRGGWDALESYIDKRGRYRMGNAEKASRNCPVYVVDSPFDADPADLDDVTVDLLVARAVPWPIWVRHHPDELLCHRCYRTTHPGQPCSPGQAEKPL